MRLLYYC